MRARRHRSNYFVYLIELYSAGSTADIYKLAENVISWNI